MKRYVTISEWPLLRRVLDFPRFPEVVQITMLGVFLAIIILGWGLFVPPGIPDKLFAKSNLVTLLIWGLWWPSMVIVAALFGRVWCMVCPLELAGRIGERIGQWAGIRQGRLPRWLRAGWFILLLYGFVQLLISVVHLHRVPMYTALYLLCMLMLGILSGILFRKRAICRAFCPVGLLLKVYGRGGMLAVRPVRSTLPVDPELSSACRSGLQPLRLDKARGDDCVMCLDCVQADRRRRPAGRKDPRMQFILRIPWSQGEGDLTPASLPHVLFIMMVSGFISYEISGFLPGLAALFLQPSMRIAELLGLHGENGWIKGVWIIAIWPFLLWTTLAILVRPWMPGATLVGVWRRIAYPVSFFVIAAHMTKAVEKLLGWSIFLPSVLSDPRGVRTVEEISMGTFTPPDPVYGLEVPLAIGSFLMLFALFLLFRRFPIFSRRYSGGTPGHRFLKSGHT